VPQKVFLRAKKMSPSSISLVVPVFNEKEIIEESVAVFREVLSRICADFEIIIVDDASDDGPSEILSAIAPRYNIRLTRNPVNLGSGMALWRGFRAARNELVVSNFADRPFDLGELVNILPFFSSGAVDFAVVVRRDRSANSFFRKITSWMNFLLIRALFGTEIKDFQFVQIYRKRVLENINITSKHTFVAPEIIIKAILSGYKYKQYVSDFHPRPEGRSKYSNPWLILASASEIFLFFLEGKLRKTGSAGK
jgi:glycosyltransferase involved in cell wall biosynthesis